MDKHEVIQHAEKIAEAFSDGFQLEDIATVVKEATELAELQEMSGPDKKALAVGLIEHVIDITDTPWLPDALTDPLMKKFIPSLIDLVVDAAKGKLALNA